MYDLQYCHANQILSEKGNKLWIGDISAAQDISWIKQHNIRAVITVAKGMKLKYDPSIRWILFELVDQKTQNISNYFDLGSYHIDKNLKIGSVLVHCGAGVSRSASLIIAYLLKYKGMTFKEALKFCKQKRHQVCPNLGFQMQLKAYEKTLFSKKSKALAVKGNSSDINYRQLPKLSKLTKSIMKNPNSPFNKSTYNQNYARKGSESTVHKKQKEMNTTDYLIKMAEFRFGITSMGGQFRIQTKRNY